VDHEFDVLVTAVFLLLLQILHAVDSTHTSMSGSCVDEFIGALHSGL
jgi:hypothetical protein